MKKCISLITVLLIISAMYVNAEDESQIKKSFLFGINSKYCPQNIKILPIEITDFSLVLKEEDRKLLENSEKEFQNNLEKGLVSLEDWIIQEDEDNWYLITRKEYVPVNNNTIVEMRDSVCLSHLSNDYSKYFTFNSSKDPLLEKNESYTLMGIKIGYLIEVDKKTKQTSTVEIFKGFEVVR